MSKKKNQGVLNDDGDPCFPPLAQTLAVLNETKLDLVRYLPREAYGVTGCKFFFYFFWFFAFDLGTCGGSNMAFD